MKIPVLIDPCPIHQAHFEIRFSSEFGDDVPGLIFSHVRERYRPGGELPAGQIPRELRELNPELVYNPIRFYFEQSSRFRLNVGPRSIALETKPFDYPG